MNNSERCAKYGFIYWKDFVIGRRGNPWWILPTIKMKTGFEVYGLSKQNKGTGESEQFEVLFDASYVEGWIGANQKIVDALKTFTLEDSHPILEKPISIAELLAEFEKDASIVVTGKNPRHSLYLKFKEYATCRK